MDKKYPKYIGKEENFQKSVAIYLDSLGLLWCHTPNEIKANPAYYKKRKQLGVKKGVLDVLIFEPRGEYIGLAIELKVGRNNPSPEQLEWLKSLKSKGWSTLVSYSLDEVIDIIDDYIK